MKLIKKFKYSIIFLFGITLIIFLNLNIKESSIYLKILSNNSSETNSTNIEDSVKKLFNDKDNYILNTDIEGLKNFYTNTKFSNWAYESEVKKINYLNTWSKKQGINFKDISSNIIVNRVKEKESGVYSVICTISTKFTYNYLNDLENDNAFSLGTTHYLDLKNEEDSLIILKEWYTDPFADSLNLKKINVDDIREFILLQTQPQYTQNARIEKAMSYAHSFCGATLDDNTFSYNSEYKNFNPQGGDCANFASQILYEGGFKKNTIWNYSKGDGTKAWVNAQAFKNYMINSGRANYIAKGSYNKIYKDAYKLRPGDFVAYEKKGKITHISTVTGLDSKGYPLVTCHNTDRLLVPYDLGWSNDNIKFHLIHVNY